MFNAGQSVQCTTVNSEYVGQAGMVVRHEVDAKNDKEQRVMVKVDATGTVEAFDPSELVVL